VRVQEQKGHTRGRRGGGGRGGGEEERRRGGEEEDTIRLSTRRNYEGSSP
jgi:hypothetical protein